MALLPACRVWVSQTVITAFQQWETQTREEDQKEIPKEQNYQLNSSKTQAESFRGEEVFWFHHRPERILRLQRRDSNLMSQRFN